MTDPVIVPVHLGSRSYDIVIGPGLIAGAGERILPLLRAPRVHVVSDETVAALYLEPLTRSLAAAGIAVQSTTVPPGEASKCFAVLERLISGLLRAHVDRKTTLVALGGGVIGDLAGFAAAIVMRGVPFVQIPTSLLAQVDSAVGGKTGIDTPEGKNLVGSFHQPRLVLADTGVLDTLPPRELRAGYAEVAKYGLIDRPAFWDWLETNGPAVVNGGDPQSRIAAVAESCRAKAAIVARDETEQGPRALLNLGHTFGHALEVLAGFGDALRHGEAVAIGMVIAHILSERLGLCPAGTAARVTAHLRAIGLPVHPAEAGLSPTPEAMLAAMAGDKKAAGGQITYVLSRGIGQAFLSADVDSRAVARVLADVLAGPPPPKAACP